MDSLITRSGAETRQVIENLLIDLAAGLKAARDRGITVRMPEFVDVELTYIQELAVAEEETSQVTPAQTETQTSQQPAVTTSHHSARGPQETVSASPAQTTEHFTSGQDITEVKRES